MGGELTLPMFFTPHKQIFQFQLTSAKGYVDVQADDEQALMDAVAQQPVSVAIEADRRAFQNYQSGVLSKHLGMAGIMIYRVNMSKYE